MFGSSKSNKPQSRIDCLIGAGTTINGDINFSGGLRVDDGHTAADEHRDGCRADTVNEEQTH